MRLHRLASQLSILAALTWAPVTIADSEQIGTISWGSSKISVRIEERVHDLVVGTAKEPETFSFKANFDGYIEVRDPNASHLRAEFKQGETATSRLAPRQIAMILPR